MDLSIIIINYKTEKLLSDCLLSVIKFTKDITYEIIVVDNDSQDNSESVTKNISESIRWIPSGYNSGFGRANNLGMREAKGDYILLLNSDTEAFENTLGNCLNEYKALEKKNPIGVLSCELLWGEDYSPGFPQLAAHTFFPNIKGLFRDNVIVNFFTDRKGLKNKQRLQERKSANESSGYVEWVAAAFALFNRELLTKDDLFFDPSFFMYSEDIEWCYRFKKTGHPNYYLNDESIYHYSGASSNDNRNKQAQIMISDFLFVRRSHGAFYLLAYLTLLNTNNICEYIYEIYLKLRKKPSVYNKSFSLFKFKIAAVWGTKLIFPKLALDKNGFLRYDKFN